MAHPPLVTALAHTARKRRLLAPAAADRFAEVAAKRGIATVADARRWLASGDGLAGDLAQRLLALLPAESQPPFAGYTPLIHLADGGMGSVWLACGDDRVLVVIKTQRRNLPVNIDSSQANEFLKRFEREARITQQIAHDNVVRCLDSGIASDGTLFMVLEYVDSGDLKDLVEARGGLPEGLALAIVYQVVDGLAEAHRVHLIHRDIKPPNVFVSHDGRAKLADFGIARTTESSRTMLTMQGAIIGSPLYMSPEQVMSDPTIDIRSDIYAIGAVLYFCLAGDAPYHGSVQEVLHKHRTAPVPDVRAVRPVVSAWTAGIIARCMAKDRKDRYQDPVALRSDLGDALARLGLAEQRADEETRHGDLSGRHGAFKPAKPHTEVPIALDAGATIAANLNAEATIAADLRGGAPAAGGAGSRGERAEAIAATMVADLRGAAIVEIGAGAVTSDTVHTIAGRLLHLDDPHESPTVSDPLPDSRRNAEMPTVCANRERFTGDLSQALAGDWLALTPVDAADATCVMLLARTRAVLGKLREAPVDVCVRNYPVAVHKDACQRISRSHVALTVDAIRRRALIEDLGAPNGTLVDGIAVTKGTPAPLDVGAESVLVLAGVATLRVRCLPASPPRKALEGAPAAGEGACGLESDQPYDAVVLTRPENRPEMAYALVLRRLRVGGPGADLVLAGARTRAQCEIGRWAGRWIWRTTPDAPWAPLVAGTRLDCGGKPLQAVAGAYEQF